MKGFEEQDLFTGATQAQGFAPDQAPDTSSFLRENMGMIDRNFAQAESVQNTELNAKLQTQMNVLKGLQAFSPKAMELATNLGKAYIESEYTKATAKARAMGPGFNYGVSEEQQNIYDQTKAALGKEQLTVNEIADEAAKNGEPLEAINYIKSLPYYQRLRAQEIFLDNKGKEYKQARDAFLMRTDINLRAADGSVFTPSQIDDQADRAQIAMSAFHQLYMVESGVAELQPNAAAMKYMYQHMDKADAEFIKAIRDNQAINTSEEFLTNAVQAFHQDRDINTLISNAQGAYNPKTGKPYTRAQARAFAFQTIIDRYAAEDTDVVAALEQPVSWDPKGRSFMELYEKEIKGVDGVLDKIDAIDADEYKTATNRKKQELRDVITETQAFLENATEEERSDPQFYTRLKQQLRPKYGEVNSDKFVDNLEKAYRPDKLRDEQMDPLMAKQAAVNGLTDEWLDAHQISYDLRRKYANEIQASNALNLPSKKDQEKAIRNLIRNYASPAPDGTTAPLVNLIEADLVNMWRTKTREYIQEGANPAEASERAVKFVMAHFEANSGQNNPSGLYYKNPNKASEYTNYKNELGKRGVKAENVTQRYHNLERLLKVYDGDFNSLIKSGQLFSKPDLEKINTIMERDPFLLSIDKNSPLFVRVQQAKALLTRNNPNLPFPKLLERTYDLMEMPVPPALQEIGPKLEQLTPSQNRFLNKLFVDGNVSQNQISRAVTPVSSVPLRPGKEYALAQTGMAGLRGLTRSGEGGYTSMFPSEAYPQMTNMTIRELVAFQKEKLRDGRKSAAVGAYQFLYPEVAAKRAGLSLDDKFTPENQDKMFDATLMQKRKAINAYLTGKSDNIEAALDELAKEFASFEYRGGRSYYNDGTNKASIMRNKAAAALKSARQEMMRGGS